MKIKISTTKSAIAIPEDFVTLSEIKKDGTFVYKFRYQVNPEIALNAASSTGGQSSKVRINILKNKAMKKIFRVFDPSFTDGSSGGGGEDSSISSIPKSKKFSSRLLSRSSRQKELYKRFGKEVLKTFLSDFTKGIPNDQTNLLSSGRPVTVNYGFSADAVSTSTINATNTFAPILENNLNKATFEQEAAGSADLIRECSQNLLFRQGIDPASYVGEKTNAITPALKQHAGVSSKQTPFMTNSQNNAHEKKNTDVLVKSLLTKVNNDFYSNLENTEKFVSMIKKNTSRILTVEETCELDFDLIQSDSFVVEFLLLDRTGVVTQKETAIVKHSQLVSIEQIPTTAPALSIVTRGLQSKNILKIRQRDRQSSQIAIFKKEFNSTRFNFDNDFELISTVNAEVDDGEMYYEDKAASVNPTVYRVVPVSFDGTYGSEFTSRVAISNESRITEEFFNRPRYLSLYHEIENPSGIRLFVDSIPPAAIALQLYKKNLTLKSDFQRLKNPTLVNEYKPLEFVDRDLKLGHVYEYKCKLIFKDGSELDAGNNIVTKYAPVEQSVNKVFLDSFTVHQNNEANLDVTFNIVNNVNQTDFDTIKSTMSDQSVSEFDDEVLSNREKQQSLFFTSIKRTNLSNGEVEDFGIVKTKKFSDREIGVLKNVKSLQSGRSYKYTVTTYAREAETMFPDSRRLANSGSIDQYLLNPYKFYNPITLSEGNIVSDAAFKKNHSQTVFSIGKVVDIQNFNVQLSSILPKITSVKASTFNKKKNIVRWKISGNAKKIDHFIILLEINEMRTVVGKAHALSYKNDYVFVDSLDNQESGALTYVVIPVYYDYSRGVENRAAPIFI